MHTESNETSFITKLSTVIVDKRNIIFVIYIAAFIFSLIAQNWVSVCNDITAYLPEKYETRKALTLMEDEFQTFATSKVMVANITFEDAEQLCDKISELSCVGMVDFENTEEYYTNGCALLKITLKSEAGDPATAAGYTEIRSLLDGYDTYISESDSDGSAELENEMSLVMVIAAVIIVAVLLLTSHAYMEVPVLLLTFVAAAVINKGTNFLFGEISFVSNSVTAVLQLALSIDYAIILIHHYSEERLTYEKREAVIFALSKCIPEILASSLTTISGLLALMFMQFGIGFDLGLCLIKSILFSLLCVFTLMPGLLMLFGKYIDKTHHKSFIPEISWLGSAVYKLRIVIPPLFVGIIAAAYIFSSKCPFVYDQNSSKTDKKNENQIAVEMIEKNFGSENVAALMVPAGDYEKEKELIAELMRCPQIDSVTALSEIAVKDNHVLTDKLTPRGFSELTDIDIELSRMLYTVYAADSGDYSKLIGNLDSFGVPLIDMFMFVYDMKAEGYIELDEDISNSLDEIYTKLEGAKNQLCGENYSRILLSLNLPKEGEKTFDFIGELHKIAAKYYDNAYIAGDSTSNLDLCASFDTDNIIVSVLSVLFVIIVLFFTFKSAGLPILLIAVIQGSVWINFSVPYLSGSPMFFLSYLIVSSIQMGANIDYAIVISNRYMELKNSMAVKDAMKQTLNFAFPTVLTSGSILSAAGFLIGKLSTTPSVVSIGQSLCRGTLVSMFLVMCVLPEILLFGDTIIEKTKFIIKKPELTRREHGIVSVDGHLRGYVSGFVDADMHGIVKGDVNARVNINNTGNISDETEARNDQNSKT